MAVLRNDKAHLCVQLSPEEAGRFYDSPFTRRVMRDVLTRKARDGEEVEILAPEGWALDRFRVLKTQIGGVKTVRSGRSLAVYLD